MCMLIIDIESEDSDEGEDSTRSASLAGRSRMTHRQAALAGVVERTELVALGSSMHAQKMIASDELVN